MGRWLARLKNQESPGIDPRKPRQPPRVDGRDGSLGFQGYPPASFQNFEGAPAEPANDPAPALADPDPSCWPHSTAMNSREISTFIARVSRFSDKGLNTDEAERLADALVKRDRDLGDSMHRCLECLHLQGYGPWRCGNFERAGVGRDLPREFLILGQRCPVFMPNQP